MLAWTVWGVALWLLVEGARALRQREPGPALLLTGLGFGVAAVDFFIVFSLLLA